MSSTASSAEPVRRASAGLEGRRAHRRFETLVPVSLRLLDETGQFSIAESVLGIVQDVSLNGMRIRVLGSAAKPFSGGLSSRQKVRVTFLPPDLHEKVEALLCEIRYSREMRGTVDSWEIGLSMPALHEELSTELVAALREYAPQKRNRGLAVAGVIVLAVVALFVWRHVVSLDEQRNSLAKDFSAISELLRQADEANDRLNGALDQAESELERERSELMTCENDLATLRVGIPAGGATTAGAAGGAVPAGDSPTAGGVPDGKPSGARAAAVPHDAGRPTDTTATDEAHPEE